MKDAMIGEALNLEKLFLQSREWTDTNLRLKGKKGPPARGAAPQGLGGVEPEGQPLRFAGANHLPFQGRQKEERAFFRPPARGLPRRGWGVLNLRANPSDSLARTTSPFRGGEKTRCVFQAPRKGGCGAVVSGMVRDLPHASLPTRSTWTFAKALFQVA